MNTFDSYDPLGDDDSGYSNVAFFADGGETSLEDQIRAKWGKYGDWKSAGQDQVADLAALLRSNGIDNLDKFNIAARDYEHTTPAHEARMGGDAEYVEQIPESTQKGRAFDVSYDGKPVGFLGDINHDGSTSPYKAQMWDEMTRNEDGSYTDKLGNWHASQLQGNDNANNLLGWSSRGGGQTNFQIMQDPEGNPVVVPTWASSSQGTYEAARGVASILALAAGAYYAPAGGVAGQVAQGGLQGYGAATAAGMLNENGDVNSLVKGQLTGAATGAIGGGLNAYGAEQGWNPALTRAGTAAVNTAVRGGSWDDAWKSALAAGLSGPNGVKLTGVPAIDQALTAGVTAKIGGGNGWEAALASGIGTATDYAAGQTGIDPKLLRAVIPLAQGDATKAARLLAQYGYNTYKPDTVAYLKSLTDIPATQYDENYGNEGRNYPELQQRVLAIDSGVDYDAVGGDEEATGVSGDSGYTDTTGDNGAQEPAVPPPIDNGAQEPAVPPADDDPGYSDPAGTNVVPTGVDNEEDRTDLFVPDPVDVIPDQTDTPVVLPTDLPPIEPETEPPPMPDIPIPEVVVDPPPVKPTVDKPTTPPPDPQSTGGMNMQALMALMQMLNKDDDESNSGYTAPAPVNNNKSPFGEIGREGGTYGN